MKPLQRSPGDLIADRRADYAEMLFGSGDHVAAAELMLGALELAPEWTLGWFRLGEMHEASGALDAAAEAWRTVLKLDPHDRAGAMLKLELIGQAPASQAPPSAFVEALFDQYAGSFDKSLVEKLGYRVPDLLFDAIVATGRARFAHAVDLGCGTGLMGERLRPLCDVLEGVDISAEMLKKADAKGIYDGLGKADLRELSLPAGEADLIAAADVFMYLGNLDGIIPRGVAALSPAGLFAFSVEHNTGPEPFLLRETRRYAHSRSYIEDLLDNADLSILSLDATVIRQDRNAPVEGLIVVASTAA